MFSKTSTFFLYMAIATPLVIGKDYFFPFVAPKAIFFRIMVEVALLMLGGAILMGEESWAGIREKIARPMWIAAAFFTSMFISSSMSSVHPLFSFWSNFERGEGGWQMLHYFAFFNLLLFLIKGKLQWERIILWQAVVSGTIGLYALGQAFNSAYTVNPPTGGLSGTFGNPAYLAAYMLFSVFFVLWLSFQKQGMAKI